MPYTAIGLPFSGPIGTRSSDASHAGAIDAEPRAQTQSRRYLQLLKDHPDGMTDRQAGILLGIERTSVIARRVPLVRAGLVVAGGFRPGPTGVKNCVWVIAS